MMGSTSFWRRTTLYTRQGYRSSPFLEYSIKMMVRADCLYLVIVPFFHEIVRYLRCFWHLLCMHESLACQDKPCTGATCVNSLIEHTIWSDSKCVFVADADAVGALEIVGSVLLWPGTRYGLRYRCIPVVQILVLLSSSFVGSEAFVVLRALSLVC